MKYGTIIKEYRNANMIYTPSEMVGTKRTGIRGIGEREQRTICTSHVERLNGTQRLFHEAAQPADAMLLQEAAEPGSGFRHVRGLLQFLLADPEAGQGGAKRPTAAMMAGLAGHVWSFDELFETVLSDVRIPE